MFAYIDRIPSFYYQLKTIFSQLMPNCGLYLFSGQGPTNFLTHCRTVELSYIQSGMPVLLFGLVIFSELFVGTKLPQIVI